MTAIDDKWKAAAETSRRSRSGSRRPTSASPTSGSSGSRSTSSAAAVGAHACRARLVLTAGLRRRAAATTTPPRPRRLPTSGPTVAYVNDGDTLTHDGRSQVRLVQIDAPELYGDCYGKAARVGAAAARAEREPRHTRPRPRPRRDRPLRPPAPLRARRRHERQRRARPAGRRFAVLLPRRARPLRAASCSPPSTKARAARRGYWGACPQADGRLDTGRRALTGRPPDPARQLG